MIRGGIQAFRSNVVINALVTYRPVTIIDKDYVVGFNQWEILK